MNFRLIEGEDYYYNAQGLMVLTEAYLRRRGYCCKNGCFHCPYGFKKAGGAPDKCQDNKA